MVSLAEKDQEMKKFQLEKKNLSQNIWKYDLFVNPIQVSPAAINLPESLSPWAIPLPSLTQPHS